MKKLGDTLTVTRIGLFVIALLFFGQAGPGWAQEGGKPEVELPMTEWKPQSASDKYEGLSPQQSEALKKARSASPPATPAISATPDRPQTVGEVFTQLGGNQQMEQAQEGAEFQGPPEPGQQLHFSSEQEKAAPAAVGESTFVDKLIRVTWSLALVCFLVWLSAKIAGKSGLRQFSPGEASSSMIEILEKKRLSPGRSIILMRVGPKVLAVAATESGYETLTEFEAEDFRKYQDNSAIEVAGQSEQAQGATTPADIARHYLSIIPGTGAKK